MKWPLMLATLWLASSNPIFSEPLSAAVQAVRLDGDAGGKRFDGIGVVDGGGATSALLKDYPEPQRSQILDWVYKPGFGASVSALYVEIPGDGNSTQGSMPSHMHTRDDLNYHRGYTWWILKEAKKRNPNLTLDGAAWSAPGWIGEDPGTRFKGEHGSTAFWSEDTINYYVKWLQGLRDVYGLQFDAIGCRNEKGSSDEFVKRFRAALNENGFEKVKLHAFDNWPPKWSLDFVRRMAADEKLRDAIDIISAHSIRPSPEAGAMIAKMGKPYWNTEQHVYKKGFDCEISIVKAFNDNFIKNGATKVVNWYGIAGVYPMEPFSHDPAMLIADSPWSGHYEVRKALWGYAHYGQFTRVGWQYLNGGCGELNGGGSFVTLKSPGDDYSVIIETKGAGKSQPVRFQVGEGLSTNALCVWFSDDKEQFVRQPDIMPKNGAFTITLQPDAIYSLSTTRGQQKGSFGKVPAAKPFPFPYRENFDEYSIPKDYGYLPHYTADIDGAFEIAERPDGKGKCLHQAVPLRPISWAPDWQPYTIIGDDHWQDYEVSADVCLNPGDLAGVMGRVNDVGTGYGCIPKGYFLQLDDQGQCRLVVVQGKKDKKKIVGDAEQQALIKAGKDDSAGGEKVLCAAQLPGVSSGQWRRLGLRFQGDIITGLVDGKPVALATNALYSQGMAGLLAGGGKRRFSTPYYDNLLIKGINAPTPESTPAAAGQSPIYGCSANAGNGAQTNGIICPGAIWRDDHGQPVNAHGGGIIKAGGLWYWFGEYYPEHREAGRRCVSCYSSTNLMDWEFRNLVVNSTAPDGIGPDWVLQRPKVYYNAKTKKFVMWMHVDEPGKENPKHYGLARIGIATCDTADGKYQWVRTFRPFGLESRDIGQFVDDDGTAYVIFESRPAGGFYIARLAADYLDVAEKTCFIHAPLEAGALVHYKGLYYFVGSHLSGWSPNPDVYATATSLKGPWSEFENIAPPAAKTYGSQSTMLVKVVGSKKTTVIFMGDQWKPKALWDSRYLWMPLEIGSGKLRLPPPEAWTLDARTGEAVISPLGPPAASQAKL